MSTYNSGARILTTERHEEKTHWTVPAGTGAVVVRPEAGGCVVVIDGQARPELYSAEEMAALFEADPALDFDGPLMSARGPR